MKTIQLASALVTTLICAAMCTAAWAQSAPTSSTNRSQPRPAQAQPAQTQNALAVAQTNLETPLKPAPGTVIPVELTKTVDAKKAKTGDEVWARVSQDVKTNNGEILVAKNTKVVGNVTEVQARTKEQKESQLAIAFDRSVSKSGEMNLPMSIQAIIAPPSNNNPPDNGGYNSPGPATGGATASSPMGSRNGPMEGPPPQPSPSAIPPASSNSQRPPITSSTQGVIGMPNLKLAAGSQNASQGSVVSSEKNNVKLESGTILLLRVSP